MAFELHSPDFTEGGAIPPRHTCEGEDVSPVLQWGDPPDGTRTFALIVDDPDAPDPAHPKMTYVHWVLYDIPAGTSALGRGESSIGSEGVNDWKRTGYGGPCPPIGRHRYFFKLYALDTALPHLSRPTKGELIRAMQGHILAEAQLMGTYEKIQSSEPNGAGPVPIR
jgi:Raf kinase inhibitor-like YbhB/YbcL family protein